MKKLLLTMVFFTGCVTARVVKDDIELKTIGVKAGRFGEGLYKRDLRKKAGQVCGGEYSVVYEGREPQTLTGIYLNSEDYFMVIKCK
jgi:hypothetical protein